MKTFCYRRFSPFNLYLISTISFLCLISLFSIQAIAQDAEKPRIINSVPEKLPLKIEFINLDKEDFLNELEIKVTNTSDKAIYSLRFEFEIVSERRSLDGRISFPLDFGRQELSSAYDDKPNNEDVPIIPNESYTFKLHKSTVKGLKKNLELTGLPFPKVFELVFIDLTFEDGTGFILKGEPYKKKTKPEQHSKPSQAKECSKKPFPIPTEKAFSFFDWLIPDSKHLDPLHFQAENQEFPDCPRCESLNTGCRRLEKYQTGGCPLPQDPNQTEPNLKVDWFTPTSDCDPDPRYTCQSYARTAAVP
ncbi:MAG TPA: hypothetical protein VF644_08365 [Pyrinomonadaceae bacterium]